MDTGYDGMMGRCDDDEVRQSVHEWSRHYFSHILYQYHYYHRILPVYIPLHQTRKAWFVAETQARHILYLYSYLPCTNLPWCDINEQHSGADVHMRLHTVRREVRLTHPNYICARGCGFMC